MTPRSARYTQSINLWGIVLERPDRDPGLPRDPRRTRRASTLRRTIECAAHLIPAERLVAVLARGSSAYYDRELSDLPEVERLVQPAYRGTAASVFLPALKIARQDPNAVVVVLPGHEPVDYEARFMNHVAKAAEVAASHPEVPVVIGTHPSTPDRRRGWIEPGPQLDGLEDFPVRSVRRFIHRPTAAEAGWLYESGGLVNTQVLIAHVRTLITLGERNAPDVLETLEPLLAAFGGPEERILCEAVYEGMPHASVLHAVFSRTEPFAVLPLTDVSWGEAARPSLSAIAS
jgi:mannose-1-phosphate guanylyltransferase